MLFFPLDSVPAPPQPSSVGAVTSSSSPQRSDPLATDYGTIDDLCDLCIGYGAMPILEEVISAKLSSTKLQDGSANQYMTTALARICNFCETHKHFNYLYVFQVLFFLSLQNFSFEGFGHCGATKIFLFIYLVLPYLSYKNW